MDANQNASLTLDREDLLALEVSLQRDATDLLSAGLRTTDPAYRTNRVVFGKVWDALYA